MKKIISLLIIAVIGCIFVGCGNSSTEDNKDEQFTVICNDGTVEKMSREELEDLRDNELQYSTKYKGAHVSGKGKIVGIEKSIWSSDGTIKAVKVQIDAFTTSVDDVPASYASNYEIGDEFEVSGTLKSTMSGFADIQADDFYK